VLGKFAARPGARSLPIGLSRTTCAHASAGPCAMAQLFEVRAAIMVASTFVARASFNLRQAGCSLTRSNSALPVPVGRTARQWSASSRLTRPDQLIGNKSGQGQLAGLTDVMAPWRNGKSPCAPGIPSCSRQHQTKRLEGAVNSVHVPLPPRNGHGGSGAWHKSELIEGNCDQMPGARHSVDVRVGTLL
jgi:hypothetical protein